MTGLYWWSKSALFDVESRIVLYNRNGGRHAANNVAELNVKQINGYAELRRCVRLRILYKKCVV